MMACLTPPTGRAAALAQAIAAPLPRIETDRLILRAPQMTDWPVLEPIWTGPRSHHIGGPFTPEDAWLDFNQIVAGWLLRGHGGLTVTDRAGTILGFVLLGHEWGDPDPELGWLLTEEAEGQGYATEAATALLNWARTQRPDGFVSYIATGNTRSVRVAGRLGARDVAGHPLDDTVRVYRYEQEAS